MSTANDMKGHPRDGERASPVALAYVVAVVVFWMVDGSPGGIGGIVRVLLLLIAAAIVQYVFLLAGRAARHQMTRNIAMPTTAASPAMRCETCGQVLPRDDANVR